MSLLISRLLQIHRRRGALTDYAAIAALVAALSIGALLVVGDRSRCILADAGRAALGLDPQGCAIPDSPPGGSEEAGTPTDPSAEEPDLETTPGILPLATLNQGYLFQFQASDPKGRQIVFLVSDGTLPPGLTLTPGGTLIGIPTQADSWTFSLTVRNSDGRETTGSFVLVVNAPPVWEPIPTHALLLPEGLPFAIQTLAVDPDGQPVFYEIAAGTLPGATLDPTTGILSGIAPGSGSFPMTLRASDPNGASALLGVTFTVTNDPVWITPAGPLPGAQAGTFYFYQLEARDLNQDQLTFHLLDGALPPGLSLDITGTIFGVPEAAGGDATFTVGVSDGGPPVPRTFSIAYTQAPQWITTALPIAVRGAPYSVQLEAQDPDGDPLTFRRIAGLISDLGLTLTPQGLLSSPRIPRNFPPRQLTFEVSDGRGGTALTTFTLSTSVPPQWNTAAGALPIAHLGQTYAAVLDASDPEGGALLFTLASGTLPPGLTLNPATGALDGVPTLHGEFSFTVRVTDPDGIASERTFTITVNRPPVFLTDATLPPARAGETYTGRIEISDPDGDPVYFDLPPPGGGTFAADGTFTLAITADRTTPISFLARIRDARNGVATRTFQIPVLGAPIWQTSTLPRHFGPGPYVAPVLATDPNGDTISYEIVSGPPGAMMFGAELRISPVVFGPVRLRATNTAGLSSERDFEIREDTQPVWISPEDLGIVALGERPTRLLAADDGTPTYHIVAGTLPDGLALAQDGRFTGVATASGAFVFTVEARDGVTPPVARTFSLVAAARPTIGRTSISPLPRTGPIAINLAIQSPDGPARLSSVPTPNEIHPSLVLTPDGILQGEDVVLAAPIVWTVQAYHPVHDTLVATRTFLLSSQATSSPGGGGQGAGEMPTDDLPPVFVSQTLPKAHPGEPYSVEIEAFDPEGQAVTLTLLITSQEAPGLNFDGQAIFGIPTVSGTYRYDLRAQDPAGNSSTISLNLLVNAPPVIIGPDLLPIAQQGRPYGPVALEAEDPEGDTITWSFAPNGSAPGLSLNAQTGVLAGTPTQAGTRALTLRAADASGAGQRSWTFVVNAQPVPILPDGYLPPLVLGQPYSVILGAIDADGDAVTVSLISGDLPPGLSLDAVTGALTGTPSDDSDRQVVVRFSDGRGGFADRTYRLAGNVPPGFITPSDLGIALIGTPFSADIVATDPNPGDTVSLSIIDGSLPEGLSFATATGILSGTPLPGPRMEFLFTVRAIDSQGAFSERTFRIMRDVLPSFAVDEGPRLSGILAGLRQNVPMADEQIQASDAYGAPLVFDIAAGALPTGLTLSPTGLISGTPTQPGPFSATVRARTPGGAVATLVLTGTVAANQMPIFTDGWLPPYVPGTPYTAVLNASDPDGDALTFVRIAGLLPPGLTLSPTGQISGTPAPGGERAFDVQVSDGRGGTVTATIRMAQNTPPSWITPSGSLGVAATGEPLPTTFRIEATDAEAAQGDSLTYAIVAGSLPDGVFLDPATGILTGIPTNGFSTFTFTVRVTDRAGAAAPERIFSITTNSRPIIDVAGLTAAVSNLVRHQPISIDLRAFVSDADAQVLSLSHQGTLPSATSLANGILTGTPNVDQTVSWTLIVSDGFLQASASVSTRVRANAAPTLANVPPPVVVPGRPYSFQIPGADTDGDALTYIIQSGTLPAGLTLNSSTGLVSGIPTDGQPSNAGVAITVIARDVFNASSLPRTYAFPVRYAPTWDTAEGDVAVIRPGQTGIQIDLVARTPDGRTITSFTGYTAQDGLTGTPLGSASTPRTFRISGTASAYAQTRSYTMRAISQDGVESDPRTFTIRVNREPFLSGSGNFDIAWNEPAPMTPLGTASDPDGDPLTWEIVSGTLPAGLSFDTTTGRLIGVPSVSGETQTLQIRVRDLYGFVSQTISRTVRVLVRPVWVTDPILPPLALGRDSWTASVVAYIPGSTASPSYTNMSFSPPNGAFTITVQSDLPTPEGPRTGRRLGQNAIISSGGSWTFTATANNGNVSATRVFTLTASAPPVWHTPEGLLVADPIIVGNPVDIPLSATDPEGEPVSFHLVSGTLPPGLLITESGLAGTPSSPGDYTFEIAARDPQQIESWRTFRIIVGNPGPCTSGIFTPSPDLSVATISYVVPSGCTQILVTLIGAGGGSAGIDDSLANSTNTPASARGGNGALVEAVLTVTPGETLILAPGRGGLPGRNRWTTGSSQVIPNQVFRGGLPNPAAGDTRFVAGGGGGGGSGIRRSSSSSWLAVAGGGGGGGSIPGARGGDAGAAGTGARVFLPGGSWMPLPVLDAPPGHNGVGGEAVPTSACTFAIYCGAGSNGSSTNGGIGGRDTSSSYAGGSGGGGYGGGAGGMGHRIGQGRAEVSGGGGGGSLVPPGGIFVPGGGAPGAEATFVSTGGTGNAGAPGMIIIRNP